MENEEILEKYANQLKTNGRSDSIVSLYKTVMFELSDFVNKKSFTELSKEEIEAFLKWKRNNKVRKGKYPNNEKLSDSTYAMYISVLKIFYRWFYKLPKHHYPEQVAHLNFKPKKTQPIKPSEIINKQDIVVLLGNCGNFREKAMISSLYESGCRVSEFLDWKVRDMIFDKKGAVISVKGKTGERRIRLIESVSHLQQWLQTHSSKHDKDAYIWCTNRGKVGYVYLSRLLHRVFKRAGIDKPCNPHAFRHSRLTELAKFLSDAKLKVFAGWVGGSSMGGIYVHLSGADLDDDLLRAAGVEISEEKVASPLKSKNCPRCDFKNSGEVKFCGQCGLPLTPEQAISQEMELEKDVYELQDTVMMLKRELEIRKMRDIVDYVLGTSPNTQNLDMFMNSRNIEGDILEHEYMACLVDVDGYLVYVPEYDNYGFTSEAQQCRAKMFERGVSDPELKRIRQMAKEQLRKLTERRKGIK
ncbi:MAG: tyrosine-type recombinase/integrase [Candidatus Bathyarchaeota archaeon]|nr:tyrosine-type recombinase/integrase [Candidatus Bathyarchaeota archaeon]